jgi:general secretion pathway protein F
MAQQPSLFEFEGFANSGQRSRGTVAAVDVSSAVTALSEQGMIPFLLKPAGAPRDVKARISTGDLALGLRVLADLLEAGMPLGRALRAFTDMAPRSWAPAIPAMERAVREGSTLASALEGAPLAIPQLVIGVARGGEGGIGLAPAIRGAADHMEAMAATRAAIRAALAYPIVLAVGGLLSTGLLVVVVLPRLARVLAELGQSLPLSTRIVLSAGVAAQGFALPVCALAAVVAVIVHRWLATPQGARSADAFLLGVPVLGGIRHSAATARATSSLAALLESGTPMRRALVYMAQAAGDAEIQRRITEAGAQLWTGTGIGDALAAQKALSEPALRLVRAGEESGRLADMVRHASRIERERAERLTRTLVRLLEPTLVLAFAGIIGVVAVALLQAVYSVRPS